MIRYNRFIRQLKRNDVALTRVFINRFNDFLLMNLVLGDVFIIEFLYVKRIFISCEAENTAIALMI